MAMFAGKKGVILGIANNRSIAASVAQFLHSEGAQIGYSFLPDQTGKMEQRVRMVVDKLDPAFLHPLDVQSDDSIAEFFKKTSTCFEQIDFVVHSIAFASLDELRKPTKEVSRQGFLQAMEISSYSLIPIALKASELMTNGGSICAMTYLGGERIIPGYNVMGVCKAALDQAIRYLAYDLGGQGIRVNGISAGPIRTLASSAVSDIKDMLKINEAMAPLQRNASAEDVAQTCGFLLSSLSQAITAEIIHVDGGYHAMGGLTPTVRNALSK